MSTQAMSINPEPITEDTARWLAAAITALIAATKNKSIEDAHKDVEKSYNAMFGVGPGATAQPSPVR